MIKFILEEKELK